jgi:hypothetical protein
MIAQSTSHKAKYNSNSNSKSVSNISNTSYSSRIFSFGSNKTFASNKIINKTTNTTVVSTHKPSNANSINSVNSIRS